MEEVIADTKTVDLFRDTPLRLIGYTNEVGEAFRPLIHKKWVLASYLAASAYVFADVVDKSWKQHQSMPAVDTTEMKKEHWKKVAVTAADTTLWQALASVIIPGITINRLCAASLYILKKSTKLPKQTRKWTTTAVGLACIPFIVKPIDDLVDHAMDRTVRKLMVD